MSVAVTEVPDSIFLIEECPHDWLFPQCSAVVSLYVYLLELFDVGKCK